MTTVMIFIGIVVLIALIYLSQLDGEYHIDRSLVIQAPVDRVYQTIIDFKTWPDWSPWLIHEPDTQLQYSDNYQQPGGYYCWDGKIVGAGTLTHISQQENQHIDQKIEFTRPFKSISTVQWEFIETPNGTEVHWIMQGKMPFLFRFMTKMTVFMISKDYDFGLHRLHGYLNPDAAHPRVQFCGKEQLPAMHYASKPFQGNVSNMISAMETTFPQLQQNVQAKNLKHGRMLTVYHKADPIKDNFECDIAIQLPDQKFELDYEVKSLSGGQYYRVECLGDYRFLELGWYKAISHIRMLKIKMDKSRPSLEIYDNDPSQLDNSNEIKTVILVPIK